MNTSAAVGRAIGQRSAPIGPAPSLAPHVPFDLVCMSHLRWDFVYQRPQHLLSRFARERRVFYIEEPVYTAGETFVHVENRTDQLYIVKLHLPDDLPWETSEATQRRLIDQLLADHIIDQYVLWYYTAMPLGITDHLQPLAVVYDCMDELSSFTGAPPLLRERENLLIDRAELVFTGGQSLYEAKREGHAQVYCFPSSVDVAHFAQARAISVDPADQAAIARPRLGFFGVIDERLDQDLIAGIADARPEWQIVLLGPIVKIDPARLPQRPNIHYPGGKAYNELPAYLAGWDVALLPFAQNESTRFISPTKTPEYLAAGKPVVSAPIRDVVRPYGEQQLVWIADSVEEWVAAIEQALHEDTAARQARVDVFLGQTSWDQTWQAMNELIINIVMPRVPATQGPGTLA